MIEVRDLKKNFGEVRALRGVSFDIPRGQVVGLLGPNGAGKSTTMRILTGYFSPSAGSARIDGVDVVDDPIGCQRKIGYLPEGNPLYTELRVTESLRFAAEMHGLRGAERDEAISRSLDAVGLRHMQRRTIGGLSKGYRQRVGLAQALLHQPPILILDEPTSGLDPIQQEEMRDLIRELGQERTIILSTHILPEVEASCERVLIISDGEVVADGTVEEIKRQATEGGRIRVVVRGEAEAARAAFEGLEFVTGVHAEALPGDATRTRLELTTTDGIGAEEVEAVASTAIGAGLALSALALDETSLGDTFASLTKQTRGVSDA